MIYYQKSGKTKLKVFSEISAIYFPHIDIFYDFSRSLEYYYLGAYPNSPDEYHLLANAANKFWEMIEV